jgi:hypothetical protein
MAMKRILGDGAQRRRSRRKVKMLDARKRRLLVEAKKLNPRDERALAEEGMR